MVPHVLTGHVSFRFPIGFGGKGSGLRGSKQVPFIVLPKSGSRKIYLFATWVCATV
jgi:hypothetical protein